MNISTTLLESLRNYNLRLDLRVDNNYDFSELATLGPRSLHLSLESPGEYLMDYCSKGLEYFQINGRGRGAFRLKNARVQSFLCESTDELEISADVQWLNASECGKISTSPEFKCDSMIIQGVGEVNLAGSIRKMDLYGLVSFQLCLDGVRCENISISDSSFHDVSLPEDVDRVDLDNCKIRKLLIPSSAKRLRLERCEIGKLEFEHDCHLEKIFIDGVTFDLERLDLDCPKLRVCALENDPSNISDLRINTLSPKFKLINQGPKIEFRINAPKKIEVEGKFSAIHLKRK